MINYHLNIGKVVELKMTKLVLLFSIGNVAIANSWQQN